MIMMGKSICHIWVNKYYVANPGTPVGGQPTAKLVKQDESGDLPFVYPGQRYFKGATYLLLKYNCLTLAFLPKLPLFEPLHKKTNKMPRRKQRRRSASRFAVTAKLISAFVFATPIIQFFFLNPKFQASSLLL